MSGMHDPYDDQLMAARYRAERDQARQECDRLRARLRDSVPRRTYERKCAAWLRHIKECETALGKRNELIEEMRNRSSQMCERCYRNTVIKADTWVRNHGGLDEVSRQWENMGMVTALVGEALWGTPDRVPDDLDDDELRAELLSRLMPAGYEWDDRLSGAVEFFESMHDLLYTVDCEEDHDGPEMVREVMRRLMPKGMEWPRFESGELVRSGDRLIDDNGDWFRAVSFIFTCDWWCIEGYQQLGFGTLSRETKRKLSGMPYGERVKRPAPKVLDADGVEIREGDKPYRVDNGKQVEVRRIDPDYGEECVFVGVDKTALGYWLRPSQLTHERPDSWERLEEDAREISHDVSWNLGNWSPSDFKEAGDNVLARIESLIPRAKALAGVSE